MAETDIDKRFDIHEIAKNKQAELDRFQCSIYCCHSTGCKSSGSDDLIDLIKQAIVDHGIEDKVRIVATGCMGLCAQGPLIRVEIKGQKDVLYKRLEPLVARLIITEHVVPALKLAEGEVFELPEFLAQHVLSLDLPFFTKQEKVVLKDAGRLDPEDIHEYIAHGGYLALEKVLKTMTPQEVVEVIKKSGLRGRGGAGFPTHVKLSPKEPEKIDYIIANCAECEPYITADYRTMIETPEKLVGGMKIILRLFDNAKGIFGVEDNKPDCIEKLKELTKDEPRIEVMALKTKYPQGGERQLIYATTGRAINSAMLPADAGCVVDNVATMVSVYQAVVEGKPSMERVVTVSGDAVAEPGNFRVPFGMNQQELVEAAGGFKTEPEKLISGGPMMGFSMFSLDVPVTKTSSSILGFTKDEVAKMEPSACINCGRCVEACPSRLIPSRLADYAEHHDEEKFTKHEGLECMECGSCSFVCPAKRPLKQAIGSMRKTALANKKKK